MPTQSILFPQQNTNHVSKQIQNKKNHIFKMPKHQTNPTGPRTPTAPTLDAGLSLFAALTTDDPKSVEIADLRAALEDTRKNLESRNLLLIRSKEALSTLGDRLKHSQTTIKTLEANECRLESELDNSRTTIKDNDMKHTATTANLREHLTTVRTQCARDITQQRDHFAQQEHEWQQKIFTANDATTLLRDQLATSMLRATDLNEELLQTQSNIENFVEDLSTCEMKLAEANNLAQIRLEELTLVQEQFVLEETKRKDLAERVSTTEQEVIDRLKSKQEEVENLQIKVDSQQKYLRLSVKSRKNSTSKKNNNHHHHHTTTTTKRRSENKENSTPVHRKKSGSGSGSVSGKRYVGKRTPSTPRGEEEQLMYILNTTPTSSKSSKLSNGKKKRAVKKKKGLKSRRRLETTRSMR